MAQSSEKSAGCLNVAHDETDCATAIAVDEAMGLAPTRALCEHCRAALEPEPVFFVVTMEHRSTGEQLQTVQAQTRGDLASAQAEWEYPAYRAVKVMLEDASEGMGYWPGEDHR
jgi:hypothetical protein